MLNSELAKETYDKTISHLAAQYADTGLPELAAKATTAWQTVSPYIAQAVTVALKLTIVLAYGALKLAEAALDKLETDDQGLADLMAVEAPWPTDSPGLLDLLAIEMPWHGNLDEAVDFAKRLRAKRNDLYYAIRDEGDSVDRILFASYSEHELLSLIEELGLDVSVFVYKGNAQQ